MADEADDLAREREGAVLNGKWTLETLLGVGGMAAVYAARHRNGARAAVKVLHRFLSRQTAVRERFLREGYAANKVDHPGAVRVLDDDVVSDGPDAGTAYIVMELLDGECLVDRVERPPPVTEHEFLTIADDVLGLLGAAHAHGIVHRDLKPENLFILRRAEAPASGAPRIKLLDFGLAHIAQAPMTAFGLALGTPSFMSPEQAAGRVDEIDGRTDLYALAATGFRIITGRRIHEGDSPIELVIKRAKIPAPPIRSVAPFVSEAFARVIDRALQFRREDRYPNAAAMRTDVRAALQALAAPAPRPERVERAPDVQLPPNVPSVSTARRARESLSRGLVALQSNPNVPPHLVGLAEPVAEAMRALFLIERSGGLQLQPHAGNALASVQSALGQLQAQPTQHDAVSAAMEAVAEALCGVYSLSKIGQPPGAPAFRS